MATLPWNTADAIKAELQPGEMVRWTGKPTFLPMLARNFVSIIFGCIFAGLSIQHVMPAAQSIWIGEPVKEFWPAVISSFFVLIGLGVIAKALMDSIATWRTAYAITDRRVLVISHLFRKRVLSLGPGGINVVDTTENLNGSGTVVFRREVHKGGEGDVTVTLALVGIQDASVAAREIEKLRLSAQPTPKLFG